MKKLLWENINFLRFLSALWGWLTIILFVLDFYTGHQYNFSISACSVIYGTILALYVGSKEFNRWQKKKNYKSKYFGEIYVIIWTLLMIFFVLITPYSEGVYKIPSEFPAVYLAVISVFIISRQSRSLSLR